MNMNDQQHLAVPPHSIEAEHAVLGGLMRFNEGFDRLGDLQGKHFYRADHGEIFAEIVRLVSKGESADVITVLAAMQARGAAFGADLGAYLNQMAQSAPSASGIAAQAKVIVDRALLRGVIHIGDKMAGLAHQPLGKSGDQVLDQAQSWITALAERRVRNEPRMIRAVLAEFVDGVSQRSEGQDSAISTGIEELDRLLNGGFRPQQLIIIAGRPSMGKTALSSDIGLNISEQHSVLMFSMEMGSQEVAGRALANRGQVPLSKVMGRIDQNDKSAWDGVTHGCIRLDDVRFAIDDTPAITLLELRMKAKAWKRKHGLDVIIVDYIGLMSGGDGDKRTDQVGSYSRGLKALAKELGVTVIALAQLSRKSEERPDKRPILSDLRDSGEIEQDGDVVMLVHRPEMHKPDAPELRGYTEVLIRKQRSGALGDVHLMFDGPTAKFTRWIGPPPAAPETKSSGGGFGNKR
jgi:replicative DNA helicase